MPSPLVDRDRLIEEHRAYVRVQAIDILKGLARPVDLEELIAYGNVGLVEAADRYDPLRGISFPTFSYYRIRGAIYDGLRQMSNLSRSMLSRQQRVAAHANDLLQAAADDEQADVETPASVEDEIVATQSLINALIPVFVLSLDTDKMPEVADRNAMDTESIERRELIGLVIDKMRELPPDEQELLDSLYFRHLSMTKLAEQKGITKSWMSRLHARAIKHLRDLLDEGGVSA